MGDSNIHICVSIDGLAGQSVHEVDEIVYGILSRFGGSISAEHGIGTLKKDYLRLSRSPEELQLMRRLKSALDPKNILNPAKVI